MIDFLFNFGSIRGSISPGFQDIDDKFSFRRQRRFGHFRWPYTAMVTGGYDFLIVFYSSKTRVWDRQTDRRTSTSLNALSLMTGSVGTLITDGRAIALDTPSKEPGTCHSCTQAHHRCIKCYRPPSQRLYNYLLQWAVGMQQQRRRPKAHTLLFTEIGST